MNWNSLRCSVFIARGGQPSASTIAGNHDQFLHAGTCQFMQLLRRHGGEEPPTSNQPPRGAQGRRLLGPTALCSCPFASLHGQVRARLGLGGYYRRSRNGGPQTCLPVAYGVARVVSQYGPSSSTQDSRPSRGAKPRGADDTRLPQERPRQGSRGGREIKARVPREVLVTQAMTIETRRATGGRQPAQCPSFLFGAKGARRGAE